MGSPRWRRAGKQVNQVVVIIIFYYSDDGLRSIRLLLPFGVHRNKYDKHAFDHFYETMDSSTRVELEGVGLEPL